MISAPPLQIASQSRSTASQSAECTGREFSLIIPAHRADENFKLCLHAVASLTPRPLEVLVVLSGSASEGAGLVASMGFRAVISEILLPPGAARNFGAQKAQGLWLAFLDADCLPGVHFLEHAKRALALVPGAVAAFGSYDAEPLSQDSLSRFRNLLHHYTHQRAGEGEAATFWTACGVVRRDAFQALGGFRDIPMEDIDFGYRLRQAGGKIAIAPSWQVRHGKHWRLGEMLRTDVGLRAAPWFRLLREERRAGRPSSPTLRVSSGPASNPIGHHLFFLLWLAEHDGWHMAARSLPWMTLVFLSAGLGWVISWWPYSSSAIELPSQMQKGEAPQQLG